MRFELAGVGRERLDVAALTLGVERVESQRRLAAARDAGDDHQLEARQRQVNVLEVVFLGSTDENPVVVHGASIPPIPDRSSHIYVGK